MYSLTDLESAEAELKRWDDAFFNNSSNNPDKFEAQRRDAGIAVRRIRAALKNQGLLEKNEQEILSEELDRLYPNAKSKTVVSHKGRKYQIKYFPVVKSRSGKSVKEWTHEWTLICEQTHPGTTAR